MMPGLQDQTDVDSKYTDFMLGLAVEFEVLLLQVRVNPRT